MSYEKEELFYISKKTEEVCGLKPAFLLPLLQIGCAAEELGSCLAYTHTEAHKGRAGASRHLPATELAKCSQRQHNRINNRIHAHSATAHSATELAKCSKHQHNLINNRIHAHSATAHSATELVKCSQRQHNRINNRIHAHSAGEWGSTRWRGNSPSVEKSFHSAPLGHKITLLPNTMTVLSCFLLGVDELGSQAGRYCCKTSTVATDRDLTVPVKIGPIYLGSNRRLVMATTCLLAFRPINARPQALRRMGGGSHLASLSKSCPRSYRAPETTANFRLAAFIIEFMGTRT
ncbi:hypothetical protein J6590_022316 [Homalodisca vitripennis]|nr:hypothetical protein J6590_022316 [Homalodisca vitripennis]